MAGCITLEAVLLFAVGYDGRSRASVMFYGVFRTFALITRLSTPRWLLSNRCREPGGCLQLAPAMKPQAFKYIASRLQ